jgi:8-oxo-dGTP diphosphatase
MSPAHESLVELRCAVAVVRRDTVLLVQRHDHGNRVLLGGPPRNHESMQLCARRETREETGLDVHPNRRGLVLEVNDPSTRRRIVELVLVADEFEASARLSGEPGRRPGWVSWDDLKCLTLRPPIGRFLPDLPRPGGATGRYLGNVWHSQRGDP